MRTVSDEQLLAQLKRLYPQLAPDEILVVKETLDRYLLLAWDIYEELERQRALTASPAGPSIEGKVDSPKN